VGEKLSAKLRRIVYGQPPHTFTAFLGQALKDLPTPLIGGRGCS